MKKVIGVIGVLKDAKSNNVIAVFLILKSDIIFN